MTELSASLPSVRDIDCIYQETNRLYYKLARGCGLSDCAYWILYDLVLGGGSAPQRSIAEQHSLSRQTVNSSIKNLEARGFIELDFEEGSRKSKLVRLTKAGQSFCDEMVVPAIEAEERAFCSLTPADRQEFVRLVSSFVRAIDQEIATLDSTRAGEHHE